MSNQMTPEIETAWKEIIAKSWADASFKQSLKDDPHGTLAAAGVPAPPGVNFVIVENEADRMHLVLPSAPGGDLSVEPMERAAVSDYDPGF